MTGGGQGSSSSSPVVVTFCFWSGYADSTGHHLRDDGKVIGMHGSENGPPAKVEPFLGQQVEIGADLGHGTDC